jgi:hypothetical protein
MPKEYSLLGRGGSFKMEAKCAFHHVGCCSALLLEIPVSEVMYVHFESLVVSCE